MFVSGVLLYQLPSAFPLFSTCENTRIFYQHFAEVFTVSSTAQLKKLRNLEVRLPDTAYDVHADLQLCNQFAENICGSCCLLLYSLVVVGGINAPVELEYWAGVARRLKFRGWVGLIISQRVNALSLYCKRRVESMTGISLAWTSSV